MFLVMIISIHNIGVELIESIFHRRMTEAIKSFVEELADKTLLHIVHQICILEFCELAVYVSLFNILGALFEVKLYTPTV